ncbi:MAG: polysaccharide biosynthesis tyrosine autokinase [Ignavibacteriales bacterium]|nr:polysaccharide biosynthesis tyrosine autokinase [Ignavibacteriales bacterium]
MKNNNFNFPDEEPIKLSYLFEVLVRKKWTVIITFFVIVSGVVIYTLTQDKMYEATSAVLVKDNDANQSLGLLKSDETIDRTIQNELEVLESRDLLMRVAKKIDKRIYVDPNSKKDTLNIIWAAMESSKNFDLNSVEFVGEIAGEFYKSVSFYYKEGTNVIKVSVKSPDPKEAALLANLYSQTYNEKDLLGSRENATGLRNFLEEQNKIKTEKLAKSDSAMQKYMQSTGIKELDGQTNILTNKVATLESELEATDIESKNSQLLLSRYKSELSKMTPNMTKKLVDVDDMYITELQQVIAKKEAEKDLLKVNASIEGMTSQYADQYSKLKKGLDSLKTLLNTRSNNYIQNSLNNYSVLDNNSGDSKNYISQLSGEIQRLETRLASLDQSRAMLQQNLLKYEGKLGGIPKQSIELAKLQRERLFNEKLYLSIGEKYEEAVLAEQSSFGKVSILDKADIPTKPVSPNVKMNLILGGLSGLSLGILFAFLINLLYNKIYSPRDVEHLGFRLLSTIPKLKLESGRSSKLLTQGSNQNTSANLITAKNPNSEIYESYLRLGVNIAYNFIDKNLNSLLVTSPGPGAGKSATALNVSITLANLGKTVLLVDTDLRRPVIHKYFNKSMIPGLTEYLLEQKSISEITQQTVVKGLDIITCGGRLLNPSLILSSGRMKTFMEQENEFYDFVIYDAPPLNAVTDAIHLAKNVDEVVMVVRSGKTYVEELKHANQLLGQVNVSVGGVVLNDFDASKAPFSYGKMYGYYAYEEKVEKKGIFKRRRKKELVV